MMNRLVQRSVARSTRGLRTISSINRPTNQRNQPIKQSVNTRTFSNHAHTHQSSSIDESIDQSISYSAAALKNRIVNANLLRLIDAYRQHGHLVAQLNPLGTNSHASTNQSIDSALAELDPRLYGFDINDQQSYPLTGLITIPGLVDASISQIINHLKSTYCSSIGVDLPAGLSINERDWLINRLESIDASTAFTQSERRNFYSLMCQSEVFDQFMQIKFPSFKRYGLEGAESMVVAMDEIINQSTHENIQQIVIGMPHRGRLNLLVSMLDYPARALFHKVKGQSLIPSSMIGHCDVASHIHTTVTKKFNPNNKQSIKVSLLPNPSHLEAVNPVSVGKTRAEQETSSINQVLCLQLHGDSAVAGQGVVAETAAMAYIKGFTVGGSVHLIVNNQVGFTATADKARSTRYSSAFLQSCGCAVLHVNGESVESVALVSRLAVEYRQKFGKDIVIDLIGWRKHGHNEIDEPSFTQPTMYQNIRARKSVISSYGSYLESKGLLNIEQSKRLVTKLQAHLENELKETATYQPSASEYFKGEWTGYTQARENDDQPMSGAARDVLNEIAIASVKVPTGFTVHHRLQRGHIDARLKALKDDGELDWATCEALAFGSLMKEGYGLRLVGQDVERGTFSHRHAILTDQKTGEPHSPLISAGYPGRAEFVSSNLSEFGVLGFELGHSWTRPTTLNMWEAQFGDFGNCAQIIIDNFIASSEYKWLKSTGIIISLPHGYDGAGPEHSSARIERFLQLSDDATDRSHARRPVNMIVVNPSTPAQYFHLLRRQMLRKYRKPLISIAPKQLLRLEAAVSKWSDLAPETSFQPVLDDDHVQEKSAIKTVMLCSGQIYYQLVAQRAQLKRNDIAFVRVEELSPFPHALVKQVLSSYAKRERVVWIQEESANAGAWQYVQPRIDMILRGLQLPRVEYIGREPCASVAVGNTVEHKAESKKLMDDAFA